MATCSVRVTRTARLSATMGIYALKTTAQKTVATSLWIPTATTSRNAPSTVAMRYSVAHMNRSMPACRATTACPAHIRMCAMALANVPDRTILLAVFLVILTKDATTKTNAQQSMNVWCRPARIRANVRTLGMSSAPTTLFVFECNPSTGDCDDVYLCAPPDACSGVECVDEMCVATEGANRQRASAPATTRTACAITLTKFAHPARSAIRTPMCARRTPSAHAGVSGLFRSKTADSLGRRTVRPETLPSPPYSVLTRSLRRGSVSSVTGRAAQSKSTIPEIRCSCCWSDVTATTRS